MGQYDKQIANDIVEIIRKVTGGPVLMMGEVKSVNEEAYTCNVALNCNDKDSVTEGIFINVALQVTEGLILIPAVDSVVWVARVDGKLGVIKCSLLDKAIVRMGNTEMQLREGTIRLQCEETTMQVESGGIRFNDGALGGLVKVLSLVERLNLIENDITALKGAFGGWTPVPNDGGAALKTATTPWAGNALESTIADHLKNDKVTHG